MNPADLLPSAARRQTASLDVIEREVAAAFGMTEADLHRPTREARWVWPRHVAMWMMRQLSNASSSQIAERFQKRDHATVLHAESRVQGLMDSYPKLKRELTALQRKIENENRTVGETEMAGWPDDLSEDELTLIREVDRRIRVHGNAARNDD